MDDQNGHDIQWKKVKVTLKKKFLFFLSVNHSELKE